MQNVIEFALTCLCLPGPTLLNQAQADLFLTQPQRNAFRNVLFELQAHATEQIWTIDPACIGKDVLNAMGSHPANQSV